MAGLAAALMATILAGLWRLVKGPTAADRLLSVQLFGTGGTALMLVMGEWLEEPALLDAALVLALLAAVLSGALVQYLRRPDGR